MTPIRLPPDCRVRAVLVLAVLALLACGAAALPSLPALAANETAHKPLTTEQIIAASTPPDWRPLDQCDIYRVCIR